MKKGVTLKLSIYIYSIIQGHTTLLWKNHAENVHQKLFSEPFLILVNNPRQPLHVIHYLEIRYF